MPEPARTLIARLNDGAALEAWRERGGDASDGASVGLVPTMGALHAGHDALVRAAAECCDRVVVSVFVNPLQFDERADFERYPRDFDRDSERLQELRVTAVYVPDEHDLYPPGFDTRIRPGAAAGQFEGAFRPGHFEGVLTVVYKLLQRVRPTHAFFGEKDAQQLFLVRRMVADLDLPVEIVGLPTVREPDGLALSSRNARLSVLERRQALCLSHGLAAAAAAFDAGERAPRAIERAMLAPMLTMDIEPEYAAVIDDRDFTRAEASTRGDWRAVVAARVGPVRLIDNRALGNGVNERRPPAKLNWSLRVLGRRPDGFHELRSWFFAIDWRDCLQVERAPRSKLTVSGPEAISAPAKGNLVLAAEEAWRAAGGQAPIVRWKLHKEIPAGAGLGGGSSDAAAALQLMQAHATHPLSAEACMEVAATVGSDLPFFMSAREAELRGGRGERLLARAREPEVTLLVAVPPFEVSTPEVFAALDAPAFVEGSEDDVGRGRVVEQLERPGPNDLEAAAHRACPQLKGFAGLLREREDFHLSGSGGAYFAAFVRRAEAEICAASLRSVLPEGSRLRVAKPCVTQLTAGEPA